MQKQPSEYVRMTTGQIWRRDKYEEAALCREVKRGEVLAERKFIRDQHSDETIIGLEGTLHLLELKLRAGGVFDQSQTIRDAAALRHRIERLKSVPLDENGKRKPKLPPVPDRLPVTTDIEFMSYRNSIRYCDLQTMALPALRRCTSPRRATRKVLSERVANRSRSVQDWCRFVCPRRALEGDRALGSAGVAPLRSARRLALLRRAR